MDSEAASELDSNITLRPICAEDFTEIKSLHEQLFPVRYADSFYQDICVGKGLHGVSIFSNIAIDKQTGEMAGFIIGQFVPTTRCEDADLFSYTLNTTQPDCVCYILTLGLTSKYRRSGLGSRLVQSCHDYAENNRSCGAIYLHVIHYNDIAIQFYKKNKFDFLREINEFYLIDSVHHSAHLYIRYMNNFKAPILHSVSAVASDLALQSLEFISSLFTDVIGSTISRAILSLNIMSPFGMQSFSENMRLVGSVASNFTSTTSTVSTNAVTNTVSSNNSPAEPEGTIGPAKLLEGHVTASVDDVV